MSFIDFVVRFASKIKKKTMRSIQYVIIILLSTFSVNLLASTHCSTEQIFTINEFDSVIVSFKDALQYTDNDDIIIDLPVYITSDDAINSLDFSFNIDQTKLEYIEVISNTEEMDFVGFVNESDSVFRFTSNSFLNYRTNRTTTMILRFKLIADKFDNAFLSNLSCFLNGDQCSSYFEGEEVMVSTIDQQLIDASVSIWPNPTTDYLKIESDIPLNLICTNTLGQFIFSKKLTSHDKLVFDLSALSDGTYYLNFYNQDQQIIGSKSIIKNNY